MGTNYYLHSPVCPHCGRGDEPLHIGKSSAGWCFSLHVIPERGINTLDDWRREWSKPTVHILDEYGDHISPSQMEQVIVNRAHPNGNRIPFGYRSWTDFHDSNRSENGPNGLVRHQCGERNGCIGHGEGTWDYIVGDFS